MKFLKLFLWLGFILYILLLTKVILFKTSVTHTLSNLEFGLNVYQINIIPFKTIIGYFSYENIRIGIKNILGNIIAFVPLGFFLPILIHKFKKMKLLLLISFTVSLFFETIQLLFPVFGSFDVDDLILNTLGGILGYFLFILFMKLYLKIFSNRRDKKSLADNVD